MIPVHHQAILCIVFVVLILCFSVLFAVLGLGFVGEYDKLLCIFTVRLQTDCLLVCFFRSGPHSLDNTVLVDFGGRVSNFGGRVPKSSDVFEGRICHAEQLLLDHDQLGVGTFF